MSDNKSHHSNQSYQAGLNGGSEVGQNRDAYVSGMMAAARQERDRAAAAKRPQNSFGKAPSFTTPNTYQGGAGSGLAYFLVHAELLGLGGVAFVLCFCFTEIVSTAILGAGIVAGSVVLGLIGLPVFGLVEGPCAGDARASLPCA